MEDTNVAYSLCNYLLEYIFEVCVDYFLYISLHYISKGNTSFFLHYISFITSFS